MATGTGSSQARPGRSTVASDDGTGFGNDDEHMSGEFDYNGSEETLVTAPVAASKSTVPRARRVGEAAAARPAQSTARAPMGRPLPPPKVQLAGRKTVQVSKWPQLQT